MTSSSVKLAVIWLDIMKENGFTLKKARSQLYLAETIIDADYTDDLAFLVKTQAKVESLPHSLE